MGLIDDIAALGADIDDAMNRYMGKAGIYERVLKKYVKAVDDAGVSSFFETCDYENALTAAHSLKGVSGNLSLVPLYRGYSEVVRLLRAGENENAKQAYKELVPAENEIINCIEKYL